MFANNGKPSHSQEYPRITFHAPDRTFDRLLRERSLSELKKTVQTKLGLKSGSVVQLAQIRHGKSIDLEDDADFDAFYCLAYEQRLVDVQVTLSNHITQEPLPVLELPRKRHNRKHELQTPSDQESEPQVENHVSLGKKRKVAFTEPSTEIREPTSGPEKHKRKKRKDDSTSIIAVAPNYGSSHDSSEALKKKKSYSSQEQKKKRKRKSAADSEAEDRGQNSTSRHPPHAGPAKSHTESTAEVSVAHSRRKEVAPTESTSEESSVVPGLSTDQALKKKASRHKPDGAKEKEAKSAHPSAGSTDDANASSGSSNGIQKDVPVRSVKDNIVLDSSETRKRKRSSTVNASTTKITSNINNRQIPETEAVPTAAEKSVTNSEDISSAVKEVVTKVTKKKKPTVAGTSPINALRGSPDSTDDRMGTNNQAKEPAKKGAKPAVASAEASTTVCLVCNRSVQHNLVDCPIVKEGPASIQKRIRSLRARKIPEDEKSFLISELQRIKAEQRESGKRKARETKSMTIEPRSRPAPSPPADEGIKDVGGHTNDVIGVSKESQPVNQTTSSSERSSATSSDEVHSFDPEAHPIIDTKLVDDNGLISLPSVGDISSLVDLDLDALVKGPESNFLSVNDMPSSDDDSDEAEKTSGEPDTDEEEKPKFAKLMQDDSSDSEGSASQGDGTDDESEKPVVGYTMDPQSLTNNHPRPEQGQNGDASNGSASEINGIDVHPVNIVHDAEDTETTSLSSGQTNNNVSALNAHTPSPKSTNTGEQKNVNGGSETKQGSLKGVSNNNVRPFKKQEESFSSARDTASGRNHVKTATTAKRADGVSLSQVSKELEDSAARNRKAPASTTPGPKTRQGRLRRGMTSNTPNQSAVKMAAEEVNVERSPMSAWTTLKEPSSSHPDDEESTVVDEFLPTTPVTTQPRVKKASKSKDNIPTLPSSQPFSRKGHSQDPIENAESNSEKEAEDDNRRSTRGSRYRRLSEIHSKPIHNSLQIPRMASMTPRNKAAEHYGKKGRANEIEDESESSSDSDSAVEKQSRSHIPKGRIAGKM